MSPESTRSVGVRARSALVGLGIGLVMGVLVWPLVSLLSSWLRLPRSFEPMALGLILIMIASGTVVGWAWDPDRPLGGFEPGVAESAGDGDPVTDTDDAPPERPSS